MASQSKHLSTPCLAFPQGRAHARLRAPPGRCASRPLRCPTCRVSQLPRAIKTAPALNETAQEAVELPPKGAAPGKAQRGGEEEEEAGLLWFSSMGIGSIAWPDDVPELLTKATLTAKLNVQLLKDHLAERGLQVGGTKGVLVDRLLKAVEDELEEVLRMELSSEYGEEGLSQDDDLLEDFKQSILLGITGGLDISEEYDEKLDDEDELIDDEYGNDWYAEEASGYSGAIDDPSTDMMRAPEEASVAAPTRSACRGDADEAPAASSQMDACSNRAPRQVWEPASQGSGTSSIGGGASWDSLHSYGGNDSAASSNRSSTGAYSGMAGEEEGWLDLDNLEELTGDDESFARTVTSRRGQQDGGDDHGHQGWRKGTNKDAMMTARTLEHGHEPPAAAIVAAMMRREEEGADEEEKVVLGALDDEEDEDEGPTSGPAEIVPLPSLEESNDEASGGHQMQVVVLATPDARARGFLSTCAVLQLQTVTWLFNVGEDLQRHILDSRIRNGKVSRIFVNNLQGTHVLGLPGMLCTISSACESLSKWEKHQSAVHVVGPLGLAKFLETALRISKTFISVPVVVHELVEEAVPEEDMEQLSMSKRGNLYRKLVPPDQLNPFGFSDSVPSSAKRSKINEREAQYIRENRRLSRLIEDARSRSSADAVQPSRADMTWTFRCEGEHLVTAAAVNHDLPSYGFCVEEPARAGRLDPEAAEALGVPKGKDFARLKAGEAVMVGDTVIRPEQVVSPDRPGRKLIYMGDCRGPGAAMRKLSRSAGMIMQGGQFPADPVVYSDDTTWADAAGELAARARARGIILTHIPVEYHDSAWGQNAGIEDRGQYRDDLVKAAGEAFGHPQAVAAGLDTFTYGIPRQEIPNEGDAHP